MVNDNRNPSVSEWVASPLVLETAKEKHHRVVRIEGLTNTFGDNSSVIKNVMLPESTLQKRHNSIAYHKCQEECAGRGGACCA